MLVDKLTPSKDWAAMATERLVKCTAGDYVHFTADFGGGLLVHRLAILAGLRPRRTVVAGTGGGGEDWAKSRVASFLTIYSVRYIIYTS